MSNLPKHIITALRDNKTSLGEHPSFPPEDEERFIIRLIQKHFDKISENEENSQDVESMKRKLSEIITQCQKIESNNKEVLEKLCVDMITQMFKIPQDTLNIDAKLVTQVAPSKQRLIPEETTDFSFEDIDDMNYLTEEIYKRRMLNALVAGASMYYANNIKKFIGDIFEINSELPSLYKNLLHYNNLLLYYVKDTLQNKGNTEGGKVDVMIGTFDSVTQIKSEALLFPILVEETIKGILELAISHGLPKNREKANYVMCKADFKLAENWDLRLGYPLWSIIAEYMKDYEDVEPNFVLMELAMNDAETFNKNLKEIFARTKKGKMIMDQLLQGIIHKKEQDNFDDYIQSKNDEIMITDDCFTSEELISDSYIY